jgi:hypothetical protein
VDGGRLLARPEWLPARPVELGRVALELSDRQAPPAVGGGEAESATARPLREPGTRYDTYSEAVRALDPPRLFENRPCYRLLEVRTSGQPRLRFGTASFFDAMDVCEAVAHELAAAVSDGRSDDPGLPLRALLGDPLDLGRRTVVPAVTALTLRRAPGSASFVLHWRDPGRVASGGGLYQVVPVGVFQPAGDSPGDDLDLWRSMTREYSEELLGQPERRGPIDYAAWPLARALDAARAEGRARAYWLGMGVDPLTLAMDILVAVVFDADVYDELFGRLVAVNEEGRIVKGFGPDGTAAGIGFTAEAVADVTGSRPMQPAGAAILRLAWRHREALLNPSPSGGG